MVSWQPNKGVLYVSHIAMSVYKGSFYGTIDVARGDPVRAGDDPGQALPGDRERRDRLQHAPRQLRQPDPDEDLLPVP